MNARRTTDVSSEATAPAAGIIPEPSIGTMASLPALSHQLGNNFVGTLAARPHRITGKRCPFRKFPRGAVHFGNVLAGLRAFRRQRCGIEHGAVVVINDALLL